MPELRLDPIQKQWVIIATERGRRPQDLYESAPSKKTIFCPFCPGNEEKTPKPIRVFGPDGPLQNGQDWRIRVVPNKYPALQVEGELDPKAVGIYDRVNGIGAHEVIIETPAHDHDLPDLAQDHRRQLLQVYRERVQDLMLDRRLRYVMVFRNFGEQAGATLPHPHSQVIATPITPRIVATELRSAYEHYDQKERCLYCDVVEQEISDGSRIVAMDDQIVAFCPYASRVPFEMHVYPRRHQHDYRLATDTLLGALSRTLGDILERMRVALNAPPYNLILHTSPNPASGAKRGYWQTIDADFHWHFEIFPRLTRIAGFEWGTGFHINPVAPETAAQYLREVRIQHL